MDLVDEENLVLLEVGQHAGEITGPFDRRAGRGGHRHTHLVGDHVREGGLAKSRRSVQEHVIERFVALTGGRDGDLQVVAHAILPDVFVEGTRP